MKRADYWNLMSNTYTHNQWFKSDVALFDYKLTKQILLHYLNPRKSDVILEVGCGSGIWTKLIATRCKKLIALDISKAMIKRAKLYANKKNVKFLLSDISSLLINQKFDKIFAVRSFEYVKDKPSVIRKFRDMLNDNGKLIVITKSKPCMWDLICKRKWHKDNFWQEKVSYSTLCKLLSTHFENIILKPVLIRLPIFKEGNNELPIVTKFSQKYFLRLFEYLTGISRKFPKKLVPIALTFSESYLVYAIKKRF